MSRWTTVVSAEDLRARLADCVVVDCRHDLLDPAAGRRSYDEGHIPTARFLDTDTGMSGLKSGTNGRHPFPDRKVLLQTLRQLGISDDTQVVAYDAQGGQIAGRLWCLLRWLGHDAVALLDGDIRAWEAAGFELTRDVPPAPAPGTLTDRPSLLQTLAVDQVQQRMKADDILIIDARAPDRFNGLIEPIDPVAGHIPGAVNRFHARNLGADNKLKPADVLRQEFETLLAGRDPSTVVHQCGSGISACANLLAMTHAGLDGSTLYPGSWSEWVADPSRPVAKGVAS